jgi:hypothetical protein
MIRVSLEVHAMPTSDKSTFSKRESRAEKSEWLVIAIYSFEENSWKNMGNKEVFVKVHGPPFRRSQMQRCYLPQNKLLNGLSK